jgi:hypothetical protein
MRLHTNLITRHDLSAAARATGVILRDVTEHGSRSHDHAFNFYLEGDSNHQSNGRDHKAATWDQWGMFIANLYRVDYQATFGPAKTGYRDASDFHWQTGERFKGYVLPNSHRQHKWVYDYQNARPLGGVTQHYCNGEGCSAIMRRSI